MSSANQTISLLVVIGNVTEENCELAAALNGSSWLLSVSLVHIVVAVFALIAMREYFKTKPIRKAMSLISVNLKRFSVMLKLNLQIISVFGFFFYFWGFASALCIYLYKVPCDYIWKGSTCFFLYSQHASLNIMGYSAFHVALLSERIYSIFFENTRAHPPIFGVIAGLVVLLFPPCWVLYNYLSYTNSGVLYSRASCSGPIYNVSNTNATLFRTILKVITIDVCVTLADFCVLLYNRRQIAKYYRRISDTYTLAKSFSLHESRLSIRLIYPFSIAHSLSYCAVYLYYILYILQAPTLSIEIDQFWREVVNLARTFNNLLLFTFLCFFHRNQKSNPKEWTQKENEADRYFKQFNQMIF
ncbi:hypothetical protein M3Y95_00351600 [Aphelenchoides besseyi]|nr:hypothetical protein M3Y95_00351600 [Aphelenchoides besseyi]